MIQYVKFYLLLFINIVETTNLFVQIETILVKN